MSGNIWEWVQDCWNEDYVGAPANGTAWESGDCGLRVIRGGSWIEIPNALRADIHHGTSTGRLDDVIGFRLAQDI